MRSAREHGYFRSVDLKRRLSRLSPPVAGAPPMPGVPNARPVGESPRATGAAADLPESREDTLERLRQRMAALLGQTPAPRPRPDPSLTTLPFVKEETPHGELFRRCERLAPSHHVGRMPVDAARAAETNMLALLALDPKLANCSLDRVLFLDTETTGLSGGAGVLAFLVGLAYFDETSGQLVLEQLLLQSPAQERAQLAIVAERIAKASLLVTYNGKAFDWPLLSTRFVMNRMPVPAPLPHLDLLHIARRLHRHRLGACKLIHLESDVLGFVRGEDIDGGDVPARYAHFLRTGDEEALRAVVDHNALDVVSMAALVGLYGEPADALHHEDLIGLARTFQRARALDLAARTASLAVQRGAGPLALKVRGQIAKARGDKASALRDFEALSADLSDETVRLELAKLYEHHAKDVVRALFWLDQGTGEAPQALERRRGRLERKRAKLGFSQ